MAAVEFARIEALALQMQNDELRRKLAERDRTIGTLAAIAEAFAAHPPFIINEGIGGIVHDAVRMAIEPKKRVNEGQGTSTRSGE